MSHRKYRLEQDVKPGDAVRVDKWLWSARFFKNRKLAAEAIKAGKVEINGVRAKPARSVSVDDNIRFRKDEFIYELVVKTLETRRQPAKIASGMYEETAASKTAREKQMAQLRLQSQQVRFDHRKPDRRLRQVSRLVKRNEGREETPE